MSGSNITADDLFGNGNGPNPDMIMAIVQRSLGGGTPIISDDSVKVGDTFTIPHGMTYEQAQHTLRRKQEEDETPTELTREFNFRHMDGAYATAQVLKERFGITLGVTIPGGMFTPSRPPELKTVPIGPNETAQVPWGRFEIPSLPGVEITTCNGHTNKEYGDIYCLHAYGPRKHRAEIESLFDAIDEYLKTKSIYRGKATLGYADPEFMDLSEFDASQVVHTAEVRSQLETSLFSVLRYTDAMRRDGLPLKRAVLLHGPYGTGKTLTGQLTAKIATDNGWTFIAARPGRDDLEDVMRTARLYPPAVVFFEDVDTETSGSDDEEVAELLDTFDGIVAKGGELVMVMTTNQIDRIHEGMFRPGRLDALIHIGELDRDGTEQLIKVYVKDDKLSSDIDYDEVYKGMEGFLPAFIRETLTRASSAAIARVEGRPNYKITTEDLIHAVVSLRPQLEQMNRATNGEKPPTLDQAFSLATRGSLNGGKITRYGEEFGELSLSNNGNGHH